MKIISLRHSVILPIAILICFFYSLQANAESPSVQIKTALVIEKTMTETLTSFGILDPDPDQILSLSLPHAGLINKVWVRLGQRVNSGDQLLEIVTAPDAHMQFLQAQSAVDYAKRELERQQRLLTEQLTTKAQVDATNKNLSDAYATLKALQQRGQNVEKETLRTPMDGIVIQLDVSQGQRVQADTSAMLIAAEQRLIARLGVEPEDLDAIRTGTPVTITSVFVPELKIETTIREVHAMVNPNTHLVEVLAAIPVQQVEQLVLGSRILGQIHLASHTALVVPRTAVLGDGSNSYLFTVSKNKAKRISVQTGVEEGGLIEVIGNLNVNDVVVITGNYELSDGMTVKEVP